MSETYYTKIVVNETVPYLNTQLGEYLQSKGFSSDTNSPKLYKNIREGGRDKIDKVKYLGKGNKVSNCNRTQVEAISLIVEDLKDLIK